MLYVVAYDIADAKRLRRVERLCSSVGFRIQYSLFECNFTAEQFAEFWQKMRKLLNLSVDRCIAYRVCRSCRRHIVHLGESPFTARDTFYFF